MYRIIQDSFYASCIRPNIANYADKLILPAYVLENTLHSVVHFCLLYEFFLTTPHFLNCSYIHQSYNVTSLLGWKEAF